MSKYIKMTDELLEECRADFEKALSLTKLADGKINFTKVFNCKSQKATVYFTAEAWAKMVMLIKEFDKEVAWHGVASRVANSEAHEYIISDILVYPQEVTGASVEMDTEKYATWLMDNADDDRFSNINMQAHSHVNMATNPSGVDLAHQEEILNMLGDEDFYIFMIWNKSFVSTNKIYDLKKNVLFENTDIEIKIAGGEDLVGFLKSAKEMVKTKSYVYSYANGYKSGYNSNTPYNPLTAQPPNKKEEEKKLPAVTPTSTKEDKPTEKKEKPRAKIGAGWAGKNNCDQTDLFGRQEFDDDPYDYDDLYGLYMRS